MSGDAEKGFLPTGPSSLCFNKDEFMKDSFSVDKFITDYRKQVPLETLRDDLNIYFRILKNAMVELINKDYADFVNLSTNLVGLDKVINNLTLPIGQLKEEILSVKTRMDEVVNTMKEKLIKRQEIRDKKMLLEHLMNTSHCVNKIEKLLQVEYEGRTDDYYNDLSSREIQGDFIERVAAEFNQLHFHLNKARGHTFMEKMQSRIAYTAQILHENLKHSFLTGLEKNDVEQLRRCLRVYATIDKARDVEEIFRESKVQPFMEKIIPDHMEQINSETLQIIYVEVLHFIPKHCDVMKLATKGTNSSEMITDYDFIVNAIWPEFVTRIEVCMPAILTPIIPDSFHEKFILTMNYLEQFETLCGTQVSVKRLREHPSYAIFMNKWNLPIYFQIRFQEIAGKLEMSLLSPWDHTNKVPGNEEFLLMLSQTLWDCINVCWSTNVYLPQLCHRFWKLTLQLISRYCEWIRTMVQSSIATEQERDDSIEGLISPAEPAQTFQEKESSQPDLLNLLFVVSDINLLIAKLPSFCSSLIESSLKELNLDSYNFLKDNLEEFCSDLSNQLPQLRHYITNEISGQCKTHLKLVSDIPRLYRRTNREVPSKASTYVANTLQPLQTFNEECSMILSDETKRDWGYRILDNVTQQYYTLTSNVLTSIKKMEESLSRLKKAREKGNSNVTGLTTGLSDDDKIRYQLSLDVEIYGKQIEEMNFEKSHLDIYGSLLELVEAARNSPNKVS